MNHEKLVKIGTQNQLKKKFPEIRVGETVRVHSKVKEGGKERTQIFEGLVIAAKKGRSLQGGITVRKVSAGIGIERFFPLHSPWLLRVERVKSGKVRRAKLYYVRRHAASPRRFKLKTKSFAGAVWAPQSEEAREDDAQSAPAAGDRGGEAGSGAAQPEEVSDPGAESPNTTR